eukprot:g812.t1
MGKRKAGTKKHERNVSAKTLAREDATKRKDEFRKGGERARLKRKLRQKSLSEEGDVSHEKVMQLIENPMFKKKVLRRQAAFQKMFKTFVDTDSALKKAVRRGHANQRIKLRVHRQKGEAEEVYEERAELLYEMVFDSMGKIVDGQEIPDNNQYNWEAVFAAVKYFKDKEKRWPRDKKAEDKREVVLADGKLRC